MVCTKNTTQPSGESGGCGELTKGPAALTVVIAHLKERALSWTGKDNSRVSMGNCKAEDSFLVPLGGRCGSEKDNEKNVLAALKYTEPPCR